MAGAIVRPVCLDFHNSLGRIFRLCAGGTEVVESEVCLDENSRACEVDTRHRTRTNERRGC